MVIMPRLSFNAMMRTMTPFWPVFSAVNAQLMGKNDPFLCFASNVRSTSAVRAAASTSGSAAAPLAVMMDRKWPPWMAVLAYPNIDSNTRFTARMLPDCVRLIVAAPSSASSCMTPMKLTSPPDSTLETMRLIRKLCPFLWRPSSRCRVPRILTLPVVVWLFRYVLCCWLYGGGMRMDTFLPTSSSDCAPRGRRAPSAVAARPRHTG